MMYIISERPESLNRPGGTGESKQEKIKMETIKEVLMNRDGMTEREADIAINDAKKELRERIANGDEADDICSELFGLEPDYIFDLL
jgi:hypothetical protein